MSLDLDKTWNSNEIDQLIARTEHLCSPEEKAKTDRIDQQINESEQRFEDLRNPPERNPFKAKIKPMTPNPEWLKTLEIEEQRVQKALPYRNLSKGIYALVGMSIGFGATTPVWFLFSLKAVVIVAVLSIVIGIPSFFVAKYLEKKAESIEKGM